MGRPFDQTFPVEVDADGPKRQFTGLVERTPLVAHGRLAGSWDLHQSQNELVRFIATNPDLASSHCHGVGTFYSSFDFDKEQHPVGGLAFDVVTLVVRGHFIGYAPKSLLSCEHGVDGCPLDSFGVAGSRRRWD